MAKNKSKSGSSSTIAQNKKARHEYSISDRFEAGIELQGWEVKALRNGKANIAEGYVFLKNGEVFVSGATIIPLTQASSHVISDPTRIRKLLLKRKEIDKLIGGVERQGSTLIPLALYWKGPWAKLEIGLAKGKKAHDKRADLKDQQWNRDKARVMKSGLR
ncbi:SsrA-binding protein SmpB [Alginatibacterium sediminis]|uniref:SsrA-binding protein n=1 Tax=Alginatibacterium sediminis TaxID=2164068 RepID=A0A420EA02_9ALTE|nr:SsrA-binding protein SmpB [Alginatibacterium sediminis]RKF17508.1 SsrA-binding protein SmpB [Alginatibacterium sediminis]